jgi:hypothetical protein
VRKSVVVAIIVSTVLALSVGTAMANDNSANKGANKGGHRGQQKGHGHHKGHHKAAKKGNTNGAAHLAGATTLASNQPSNKANSENSVQDASFAFKGTVAQDGAQDSPLQVKVKKASDAAKALVGQDLRFNVSSDTKIYRDNADEQNSSLDAKLSDLKSGDEVVIQANGAQSATSFTASMISAEPSPNTADIPNTGTTPNTAETPTTNNRSLRLAANKNP